MFVSFIRATVIGFVALTLIYTVMRWFVFSRKREALEKEFDEEVQNGDRDAYVQEHMKAFAKSPMRKLLLLVYVVPFMLYVAVMYMINFS